MTAIFYTLLLVSIFFISCGADEAVIQAPFHESGSQAPFHDTVTEASFDELENAETKLDAQLDRSATTFEDQLAKLERLIGIFQNGQKRIVSHVEEVEEKLTEIQAGKKTNWMKCMKDTHCKFPVYKDCKAVYKAGHTTSGVYTIKPDRKEVAVYCEQKKREGGWTVFQRRINGSVNFYRGWDAYKHGFGSAAGEYWIGNDHLHALTSNQNTQLLVELQYKCRIRYARYTKFSVKDEGNKYRLQVAGYASPSPPGDSLTYHNGLNFSTHDRDNDNDSDRNCALNNKGGWWYEKSLCFQSHLNGPITDVVWYTWKGYFKSLTGVRLMVKTK